MKSEDITAKLFVEGKPYEEQILKMIRQCLQNQSRGIMKKCL